MENKFTNCLNFEHTIFLSESVLEFLLTKNKFRIKRKKYFKEHSIFYSVYKDESLDTSSLVLKNEYEKNKKLFFNLREFYQKRIAFLNELLQKTQKEVYLFGSHLFAQYLIYQGLDTSKIKYILDNNKAKQEKRLYGTRFFVKAPQILANKDNALLILNAGAYNDEIERDIKENINAKVEIIKL